MPGEEKQPKQVRVWAQQLMIRGFRSFTFGTIKKKKIKNHLAAAAIVFTGAGTEFQFVGQ